jgi:hypothetical protein
MSHRKRPQPMTPEISERVRELHRKHEALGHEGILRLLEDEGIVVDEYELRTFMEQKHLSGGATAVWAFNSDPLRARRGDTGKR